jgi:GTPase SAR1 family protein
MSEQLTIRIGVVGGEKVGKRSLVEDYICKYFNGRKLGDSKEEETNDPDKYSATIVTNVGPIIVEITVIRDIKKHGITPHDAFMIVSDVTDRDMHTIYVKWYTDLTYCLGHRLFIVNCFNKTDISTVPTYIFESSAPAFDISAKTTSGINDTLTYILRNMTEKENLLICM